MRGEYSLADIKAVTDGNGNGSFGGFGGDWAWIIVLFLIFGWGRNGNNGFGGSNGGGAVDGYVLATDFATIERKLDAVNNGICDATFALNNTIVNGNNAIQQTLCQGFNGLNVAYLQGNNALASQLADCCCKTQRAIDGVNYNMATNTCAITNNATMNTRDIIDAVNANYRALHEEIVANRIEDKNAQITAQQNEINALRLKASQEAQNNYLISQLRPCPDPAYIVPNPNCCYNYTVSQNSCCGSQFI